MSAEDDLTQQEREKIIEVLLSQERVLTLLYDKTFPPRALNKGGKQGTDLSAIQGIADLNNMEFPTDAEFKEALLGNSAFKGGDDINEMSVEEEDDSKILQMPNDFNQRRH
jgi:hypothetical protein